MSDKTTPPHPVEGRTDLTESDLASERMGDNALQGDDQDHVRNQRHATPDVRREADGVVESFEKADKETRARRDLGKGNRTDR